MNPEPPKNDVYSLWLMPERQTATSLQTLIRNLSKDYSTPSFEPHVTLIGSLNLPRAEAVSRTKTLAARIQPFIIKLNEVAYLDQYFRCVFIKAERTAGLMAGYLTAHDLFGKQQEEDYMPHLSLVYGDLPNIKKKEIMQRVGAEMSIEFFVQELHLYYTGGPPDEWHRVLEARIQSEST